MTTTKKVDVLLVGAGIMSTTLATLLSSLDNSLTIMTVSYTHLDVYKRQSLTNGKKWQAVTMKTAKTKMLKRLY